jgi:putative transposase
LEDLNLAGMTRSAKGTIGEPGTNVAAEAGLDRSLAEAAPGKLGRWVLVEAEEAWVQGLARPLSTGVSRRVA